jgi:uncharacterized protein YgiM (DUF1202 family)
MAKERQLHTMALRLRIAAAVLATTALTLGLFSATSAKAADTQVTATVGVNIRSGPSTNSPIIGGLYRGQTVSAISSDNGWTKIRFIGGIAYIASNYLTKGTSLPTPNQIGAGSVKITTTALNLRTGPGLSYRVITVIKGGTPVTMTGNTARGFAEVYYGKTRGWSSMQYLASSMNAMPRIIGTRVAMTALNIWVTSSASTFTTEVPKGTKLSITGTTQYGRAQIIFQGKVRWVTAKWLSNPTSVGPTTPTLPKIIGYRYATAALNIRSSYADSYRLIAEVPAGTRLAITGVASNGRAQIIYSSAIRWVTARYLSTTRPTVAVGSTPIYAVERGLAPYAIQVHRAVRATFPQITTYYGVAPRAGVSDHPSGRALDIMIPNYMSASGKALGYELANWARANARSYGIKYVIWNQRIWNIERDAEGWRYMADRGGDSANHKNHVHISVYGGSAT